MTEKFNYVIGRYWEASNQICCYSHHSAEVFYGNDAETTLKRLKLLFPEKDYKIFKLVEIDAK